MSIFRFLLRWSWLLILMTMVGSYGGYTYLQYGPLPYKSSATLMLRPQADSSGLPLVTANPQRSTVSALALAGQAASPSVYEASSRALAGQLDISSEAIATLVQNGRIQIAPVGSSSFIAISATDPDPQRAWLLADGYARGLMQDLAAQARLVAEQQQADLRAQAQILRQQMASIPLQLNNPGAEGTYSAVHARILQQLLDTEAKMQEVAQTGPPVVRHGETSAPVLAITPSRVLIAGAAAGGVGGLALSYLCELLRQYVRRRSRIRSFKKAAAAASTAAQTTSTAHVHTSQPTPVPAPPSVNGHQSSSPHHLKGGRPKWAGPARV
ncbi:MAG: hypothetical protein AB7K36_02200 [Chloroflexota bacterium]